MRELWLKFKRFYLPKPLAFIVKYIFKGILKTCRIDIIGLEHLQGATQQGSCLVMLWHSRMAMTCEFFQRFLPNITYTAFLSNSRDGEPIACLLNSYTNAKAIRVAHNAKHKALHEMINQLQTNQALILVTPDGPKGPAKKIKPGIIMASQATGAPIVPFSWQATHFWQLKSWDQFRLPKPFSVITINIGEVIKLPKEMTKETAASHLEEMLNALESCPLDMAKT